MQNNKHFDLWAKNYDAEVNVTDNNNEYPLAGYKKVLGATYNRVMQKAPARVLDIGIGTGTLSRKLYEQGNYITGIDFSDEMLNISRQHMPDAELIQWDFTKGLPQNLGKFDFVISTYALHHLTDAEKCEFIPLLLNHLDDRGVIIIGDVGFENRELLEECKVAAADDWDDEESYFVLSDLRDNLVDICQLYFHKYSHCSGILLITHK